MADPDPVFVHPLIITHHRNKLFSLSSQ
uniref:Uncharacterized protein n=1 Tax=Anguilla anguilla TaxID=7936 RepID=A0A0E9V0A8_ANGAN